MATNNQSLSNSTTMSTGSASLNAPRNVNTSEPTRPAYPYPTLPYYPYPAYSSSYGPLPQQLQYPRPIPNPQQPGQWLYPVPAHPVQAPVSAPSQPHVVQQVSPSGSLVSAKTIPEHAPANTPSEPRVVEEVSPPSSRALAKSTKEAAAVTHTPLATIEVLPDSPAPAPVLIGEAAHEDTGTATTTNDTDVAEPVVDEVTADAEDEPISPTISEIVKSATERLKTTTQVASGQKRALAEIDPNADRIQRGPSEVSSDIYADDANKTKPIKRRRPSGGKFTYAELDALATFVDIRKPIDDEEWQRVGEAYNEWAEEQGRHKREWENLRKKWEELVVMEVKDGNQKMERCVRRAKKIDEQIRKVASEEHDDGEDDPDRTKIDEQIRKVASEKDQEEQDDSEDDPDGTMTDEDILKKIDDLADASSRFFSLIRSSQEDTKNEVADLTNKLRRRHKEIQVLRSEVNELRGNYNGLQHQLLQVVKKQVETQREVALLKSHMTRPEVKISGRTKG